MGYYESCSVHSVVSHMTMCFPLFRPAAAGDGSKIFGYKHVPGPASSDLSLGQQMLKYRSLGKPQTLQPPPAALNPKAVT